MTAPTTSDPEDLADLLRPDGDQPAVEDPDDGAYWLLQLIAAVEFLRRGDRHGFTVWDAVEEALRHWSAEQRALTNPAEGADDVSHWGNTDRLHATLVAFTAATEDVDTAAVAQQAIRRWNAGMTQTYNTGHRWDTSAIGAPPRTTKGRTP